MPGPPLPGITGFLVSRWQDLPVPPVPEHHADAADTAACFGDFFFGTFLVECFCVNLMYKNLGP